MRWLTAGREKEFSVEEGVEVAPLEMDDDIMNNKALIPCRIKSFCCCSTHSVCSLFIYLYRNLIHSGNRSLHELDPKIMDLETTTILAV